MYMRFERCRARLAEQVEKWRVRVRKGGKSKVSATFYTAEGATHSVRFASLVFSFKLLVYLIYLFSC